MSWRVIAHGTRFGMWMRSPSGTRIRPLGSWCCRFAPRLSRSRVGRRSFWTPYPLEATSKSSLFIQAERIPDAALSQLLAERLS